MFLLASWRVILLYLSTYLHYTITINQASYIRARRPTRFSNQQQGDPQEAITWLSNPYTQAKGFLISVFNLLLPWRTQWTTSISHAFLSNPYNLGSNLISIIALEWPGNTLDHLWFGIQYILPTGTIYPRLDFSLQSLPLGIIDQSTHSSDGKSSMPNLLFNHKPSPPSLASSVTATNTASTPPVADKRRSRSPTPLAVPLYTTVWRSGNITAGSRLPISAPNIIAAPVSNGSSSNGDTHHNNTDDAHYAHYANYDDDDNPIHNNGGHIISKTHHTRKEDRRASSPARLLVREKNRIATTKYRSRQRKAISQLTVQHEGLENTNRKLCATLNDLDAEAYVLKHMMLDHGNYGCELIQRYFRDVAAKVIQDI